MSDEFTKKAHAKFEAYRAQHPQYNLADEQPHQGATNRVLFAQYDDELTVFKIFCEAERKHRECFAYKHWQSTGLIPRLIDDEDPEMIVTTHIPGVQTLLALRETLDEDQWYEACHAFGVAVASLISVPLAADQQAAFESQFYGNLGSLEQYLGTIVELAQGVHKRDADFQDAYWSKSLNFIQSQLPTIYAQPRTLYHQDPGNHSFYAQRFSGFFDLEMCRVGGTAMQLAYCAVMFGASQTAWQHFVSGWESAIASELGAIDNQAIAAAVHLMCWRIITRYMSYDGTPGSGFAWADAADPDYFRKQIDDIEAMFA